MERTEIREVQSRMTHFHPRLTENHLIKEQTVRLLLVYYST
jgi:hypothetical protein